MKRSRADDARRQRNRYRAQGLCGSCPTPAVDGKTMCARHLAALRARNIARYRADGRKPRRMAA